ncbi:MAG: serine/threonine-protein kinase [Kofleriaceae bacterium]
MPKSPRPADVVSVGQVLLGKYRVDSILGQGGMGIVAACTHLALGEQVALKILRPDVLRDRNVFERFAREARSVVKLKSEHIARVLDIGTLDNDLPYIAMEYLEGHDLGTLLAQRGKLPAPWVADLILQAAEALAEAHAIGIVHRDIKPTNLFVTWRPDGSSLIKVLDFGISKAPTELDNELTQSQAMLGTPAYMSPEQMRSAREVDARSDIWSLGTVMYELLEGQRPFKADTFSELCINVTLEPPAPMTHAPEPLRAIVMRCLSKTIGDRYRSMAELGRDLVPYVADPQHGSILVERMDRVLRRSLNEAEIVQAVPRHAVDVKLPAVRLPTNQPAEVPAGTTRVGEPARPPRLPSVPPVPPMPQTVDVAVGANVLPVSGSLTPVKSREAQVRRGLRAEPGPTRPKRRTQRGGSR